MNNKIVAIIGPSGSGKTTIGNILKEYGIPEIISYTTRPPRKGEINGVSYHFVDEEAFKKIIKVEEVEYSGASYGTAKKDIENNIPIQYIVITYEGVLSIKKNCPDVHIITVYVDTPKDVCIQRMIARGDTEENIRKRISNYELSDEFANRDRCDYIFDNTSSDIHNEVSKLFSYIQNR